MTRASTAPAILYWDSRSATEAATQWQAMAYPTLPSSYKTTTPHPPPAPPTASLRSAPPPQLSPMLLSMAPPPPNAPNSYTRLPNSQPPVSPPAPSQASAYRSRQRTASALLPT